MSSCSTWVNDQENHRTCCQSRGFITPPSTRETNQICPDTFHVIHKVPYGDSPYVRAKRVQLIDKDPSKAISLFWAAINSGDRVDSALKDMAVVMKQLDRSDEAIEAIKSFRHLCPSESQESLDNILVDLYKQSGRIEEEIEILRFKVKQVEEGFVFGGKRVKMARSQGKKILIPVEKEYSRLLGNLAWAYMQQKDFKSAEEHYRKALSFDSDKNKQCNLAMCLMHMNKLTEAKFLLQAVKYSYNQCAEESHAKSYERASQMLVELESQKTLKPMKHSEHNTDVSYEKRAEFDWRRNHSHQLNMGREAADHGCKRVHDSPFCGGGIPRVPFTQPQQNFNSGDQRNTRLAGSGYGGFCRKLSYGPSGDSENQNQQTDWRNCKKSWADVVDEQVYLGFNNENVDFNIISETSGSLNQAEKLSQKIESIDLDDGYITQPEKPKNQTVRRSLYFNQNQMHGTGTTNHLPLPVEALNFEGQTLVLPEDLSSVKSTNQTKRLQVFQDITHAEK